MGQPHAKTVGGTPNSPLGADFTNFLMHGLQSGSFGGNGVDQAQGFAGGINHLLSGRPTDTSSLMQGGFNLGNAPSYQGPTNFSLQPFDTNNQFSHAIASMMANQQQQGLSQVNSQFSGGNAGSNSNAQGYANAMYMANAMPNMINALGQQNYQQQGLNLQSLGLGANTGLGIMGNQLQGRSQDMNYNMGLGNLGLGSQSLAQQGQMGILQNLFGQYGNLTALATPQAQTYMNPSGFSQFMSALGSGAQAYGNIAGARGI